MFYLCSCSTYSLECADQNLGNCLILTLFSMLFAGELESCDFTHKLLHCLMEDISICDRSERT